VLLGHRRFDPGFRTFTTNDQAPYLLDESSVAASLRVLRWIVSGEISRSRTPLEVRNTRAVRLSTNVGRNVTLGAEFLRFSSNDQRDWSVNVFVRAELDADHWVRSSARTGSNDRALELEAGKQVPQGEGFGWRAGLVASQPATGGSPTQTGHLYAAWNARPATVEFFGSSALGKGGSQFAEIDVSGSLVAIGGYVGLARRINDGFALARLGVPQKGIEVSVNNQVQGHTDANGQLLIPQVSAYIRQRVSVNEHELGMQYDIAEKARTIAVPNKGGTIVDFGARRIRAAAGMAWIVRGGARTPVASQSWPLSNAAGRQLRIETSRAGDFYLEDTSPGRYQGTLELEGRRYACRLEVPDFTEAVHELKEGVLCE
jgi:outer membrane usher protein FimD/PapC